jgi:hypothetical protein
VVPCTGVDVFLAVAEGVLYVDVSVAEDVNVGFFLRGDAADLLDNVFLFALEGQCLAGVLMTRRAPLKTYPHRKIRVEKVGVQELRYLVCEDPFDEGVTLAAAAETVAVPHIDTFAVDFAQARLVIDLDAKFIFQVMILPNIVIAGEIINLHARLCEFCQFVEKSVKTLGNHVVPFVPKIKNVAQKVQRLRIGFYEIEPTDYAPLTFQRNLLVWCAEVKIGGEVSFHKL